MMDDARGFETTVFGVDSNNNNDNNNKINEGNEELIEKHNL
jgi:hypothetical protein